MASLTTAEEQKIKEIHATLIEEGQGLRLKSRKLGNETLGEISVGETVTVMVDVGGKNPYRVPMDATILGFVLMWDEYDSYVEVEYRIHNMAQAIMSDPIIGIIKKEG